MSRTKPRKKPPVWRQVALTTIKDPVVDSTKLAPGQTHREIVVAELVDSLGRRWRQYGADEPMMLGTPPVGNGDAG